MTEETDIECASNLSRRTLLRQSAAAGAALAGGALLSRRVPAADDAAKESLKPGTTILFQGDSITDAGRRRPGKKPNDGAGLGRGYPFSIATYLLATKPKSDLRIFNRGISGNKVPDLAKRWKHDCVDLKPDILSILIGVNDIWHKLNGQYQGTVADYESGFNELLKSTKATLPKTKIVVCEPFVLRCGAVTDKWFPEFDERRAAAKRVAEKAGATWIPFQTMFDDAVKAGTKPAYWARDGVHPSVAGHGLMAKTWIESV